MVNEKVWRSSYGDQTPWIKIDFNDVYDLRQLEILKPRKNYGLRDIVVEFSDGSTINSSLIRVRNTIRLPTRTSSRSVKIKNKSSEGNKSGSVRISKIILRGCINGTY